MMIQAMSFQLFCEALQRVLLQKLATGGCSTLTMDTVSVGYCYGDHWRTRERE